MIFRFFDFSIFLIFVFEQRVFRGGKKISEGTFLMKGGLALLIYVLMVNKGRVEWGKIYLRALHIFKNVAEVISSAELREKDIGLTILCVRYL